MRNKKHTVIICLSILFLSLLINKLRVVGADSCAAMTKTLSRGND